METHIGLLLKKISEKMERRANDKREESGVTFSQGKILWYLHTYGKKGQVTLRDIERYFDISHATVALIFVGLDSLGLGGAYPHKHDRRAKNVSITETAEEMFRKMKARQRKTEETLLKGFSDEERREFKGYLQRIYENLE